MFYVYKLTNKSNFKSYIGKSNDALKRLRTHIKISKGGKAKYPRKFHAIHAAIAKYGIESFYFEILHQVESEEQAFELETNEILKIRKLGINVYNLSDGGEGNSGWHHTNESKLKMSITRKGRVFSSEHKKALSKAQSGNKHSQFGKHQDISWKEKKSKLTSKQVSDIKYLIKIGTKQSLIANTYGVSISTISMIKSGKIWNEVITSSEENYSGLPVPIS